ncbi:hypothetical protein [Paractinoplanes rishiriensis]|uniref:LmbE family protein n=1 Tax=Paractinoplanes rishiriensis TaxID=1050105 RepID=A0A919N2G9_9ACTN|nr:hypothetical protein [Actinoplanes rishiriensis]GIF00073.1 hypothetical protein Ari01nite_75370 [Actinoplanes rishiriensis]
MKSRHDSACLPEENFQRVLCVVAHPDDMEYGTSSAVSRAAVTSPPPSSVAKNAAVRVKSELIVFSAGDRVVGQIVESDM